jgi:hypothetical protein
MVGKDGAEIRRQRIAEIAQAIQAALYKNNGEPIPLNKTVVALMIKIGLTKPKTLELLNLLNEGGEFELDIQNDKIKKPTL